MKKIKFLSHMLCLMAVLLCCTTACKKKQEVPTTAYTDAILSIATSYNTKCPIANEKNGTTISSVTYNNNALTFVCEVTDKGIVTVDLDSARTDIIASMSDNMKEVLIKGKCDVVYKYKSPNDSSVITILPQELQTALEAKQQKK